MNSGFTWFMLSLGQKCVRLALRFATHARESSTTADLIGIDVCARTSNAQPLLSKWKNRYMQLPI
jgi:hypothetical protein